MAETDDPNAPADDFFGALLSRFDEGQGPDGAGEGGGDPDDDGELASFLADLDLQDKDREASLVREMLESLPALPGDDDALLPGGLPEDDGPSQEEILAAFGSPPDPPRRAPPISPPRPPRPAPEPGVLPADEGLTTTGLTLRELFGLGAAAGDDAQGEAPADPPADVEDPLAPRRVFADRRLYHFLRDLVRTPESFAILRMMLTTGLSRLTLFELEGALVLPGALLEARLEELETAGLIHREGPRYSLNPRSRSVLLLGQAVAVWHDPEGRGRIWSWLHEGPAQD